MKLILIAFAMLAPIGVLSILPVQTPSQIREQSPPTASSASVPLLPASGAATAVQESIPAQSVELPGQASLTTANGFWHSAQTVHVRGQSPFNKAFAAYQSAEDDEAKNTAKAELRTELDKLYDTFIENQSKQIDELEQRLEKLRTQLEKRREAKSRMVELKLQMVLSQAEGLGFPDSWQQADPFGTTTYQSYPSLYGGERFAPSPNEAATPSATTSPASSPDPEPRRDAPRGGRTR